MKHWIWLLLVFGIIGCNERDQTDAKINAAVALASAKEAASIAWKSFSEEAAKVTAESSKNALEKAKWQTAEWQKELSKIKVQSPLSEAQAKAAREQMAKIEAALSLKSLEAESHAMVDKATETGKIAKQDYDEASRKLSEIDAGYRNLKERLADAQAAYDEAARRFNNAMQSLRDLQKAE